MSSRSIPHLSGNRLFRDRGATVLVIVGSLLVLDAHAVTNQPTRLAIAPFYAPKGQSALQETADAVPELLSADLSRGERFQLVERERVSAIWNELHMAADGLQEASTVMKLGHVLQCDWLVTGSLVVTETRTQIWTKVIEVGSGSVLDLEVAPFEGDVSKSVSRIAAFLGRPRSADQPRPFIALGRFLDMSISATREDWSRRLRSRIEEHFLAEGIGVAEREAVNPIFEEFQFETIGLAGAATNRVKLRPAFWLVDVWLGEFPRDLPLLRRLPELRNFHGQFCLIPVPFPIVFEQP